MALLSGSVAAAEDAVQEAMARAWELEDRGRHVGSLPGFVTTVARNLLRDRFRRTAAELRARARLGARQDPAPIGDVERRADLLRALRKLPARQREVAVLHYYLDLDVDGVASVLGIPPGTVKSALHRARRSLAAALLDDEPVEVGDVRDR